MTSILGDGKYGYQADPDYIALLMQECDDMEASLGDWLVRIGARIVARSAKAIAADRSWPTLDPPLWRTLIVVWLSSPLSKRDFSEEARGGMRCAVDSMDDRALVSLVAGVLDQRMLSTHKPAA
jgi:hypothetical protein